MPCRNAGSFLKEAVDSVLQQSECLELLVADGGSSDGSLAELKRLAQDDSRVRIISRSDSGPADALNKAFRAARGTIIGWLNADDICSPGALLRALSLLEAQPELLMVYGEGEEFDEETGLIQRYPTLPPSAGLDGFRSHCYICQPTVVFRRSMGVLLGDFDDRLRTAFDFDYWLRAFKAFPHRIGYVPHVQGRTRLHRDTITSQQRAQATLEALQLEVRYFGASEGIRLHNYALELQLGLAQKPQGVGLLAHVNEVFEMARPLITSAAFAQLQNKWLSEDSFSDPKTDSCSWESSTSQLASSTQTVSFSQRPFGVNLIGHAFETFGVGEDIRMAAAALQAAEVPCCVIYQPAVNGAACSDSSLEALICNDPLGGPYAFNLVCMTAPMQARWLSQNGCEPLRERYTITSWPWETQEWPDAFLPLLDVADELWPSSEFTAEALQKAAAEAGRPLQVMPMAAQILDPERYSNAKSREATRRHYGLPLGSVLFGYGFDLNSTAIRKNPLGALEAFQKAFPLSHLPATFGCDCNSHPLSEQVSLLIKTFPPRRPTPEWELLKARVSEDHRICLVAESLSRSDLLALYGSCDVFLSLHRSEGFGRGIAEALQLGVNVIATDFGGNTDFCSGPLAHPVRWRKVPVPRGSYPYADGHYWAEPDLDHAAQLCQKLAERQLTSQGDSNFADKIPRNVSASEYINRFSFSSVGKNYRLRLMELWSDRFDVSQRLLWRNDAGCDLKLN